MTEQLPKAPKSLLVHPNVRVYRVGGEGERSVYRARCTACLESAYGSTQFKARRALLSDGCFPNERELNAKSYGLPLTSSKA